MSLFWELHRDLPREGPGDDASTARALRLLEPLVPHARIVDFGCGPGAQTMELARRTDATITAVDLHEPFLAEVRRRSTMHGFAERVVTCRASMADSERFAPGSFDVVWSEGAVYVLGFRQGLRAWKRLIADGGALAVTELTWLVDEPPPEARAFWSEGYPAMQNIAGNLAVAQDEGYDVVGHFVLPESAWWDGYYGPLEARIRTLRATLAAGAPEHAALDAEQREIDLYRRASFAYGYVFYVLRSLTR